MRRRDPRRSTATTADGPLAEYRRKRDFAKTPEPAPGAVTKRAGTLRYFIQKHAATRLHYDFRLELDGVLLSWAVTRGPSLDPADKRLAVHVEDHPLEYGTFEGTIPKGEYGGGTVMLWDRGTWSPIGDPHAGLAKGHLAFELHGERLQGGWDLVRMKGEEKRENWLLIKKPDAVARPGEGGPVDDAVSVKTGRSMDDIASGRSAVWHSGKPKAAPRNRLAEALARAGRPATAAAPAPAAALTPSKSAKGASKAAPKPAAAARPRSRPKDAAAARRAIDALVRRYPEPQLATLVDAPPEGDRWLHEIKYDGYRLLGYVAGGVARLRTRNGNDWTAKFPAVVAALEALEVTSAVIDMEAVVVDAEGRSSFQALQAALGGGGDRDRIIAFAFDLLEQDGEDLAKLPLEQRKQRLQALLEASPDPALRYSKHLVGQGAAMLAESCRLGLEGIVSKQAGAPYRTGRQQSWLKSKCTQRQEFVVLGYSDARTGPRAIGALYLGYRRDGKLRYAGKVGTGFTLQSARDLAEQLGTIAVDAPPFARAESGMPAADWRAAHWVEPKLLAEVAFTEWTDDGHIRHPSFQGLRADKPAREVTRETPRHVRGAASATSHAAPAKAKAAAAEHVSPAHRSVVARAGRLELEGVTITHPERVISVGGAAGGITKGDLAQYHAAIVRFMLPRLARRPLTLVRCPQGIEGGCFYQRSAGRGLGDAVREFSLSHKGERHDYLYIEDARGLLTLVQMDAIEIHPWGATIDAIDKPERLVFDLDPAPDVPFEAVKLAAQDLRHRLRAAGLDSHVKMSGGKGLHVLVPIVPRATWAEAKQFAADLAHGMVADVPRAYVATMTKAKRTGKIFIDYFRNDITATSIADYGVRARPGCPVALPIEWKELDTLESPSQFSIQDVLARLERRHPPAEPKRQKLPRS